ncbi:MAG: glycosyltransferase family 39 protein [Planctomycetota bacterium]
MSEPSTEPRRSGGPGLALGLVAIAALSCFLRLWPIEHGAPRPEYVPDTHVVRNALHIASARDPIPPANAYSSYPYLLSYALLPVYVNDYVVGRLQGEWAGGGEYGVRLMEDPWRAHRLARIVLALLAATAPLFVFLAARAGGLGVGAWIAAYLAATALLHVQLSVQERPWAPMTAAVAATAWAGVVHARTGSRRALMWCGFAAAIAFSMHQAGALALGIAGIAWAVAPTRRREGVEAGEGAPPLLLRIRDGLGCVVRFWVVALALGHPYLVRYGLTSDVAADDLVREGQRQLTFGGQQMILALRWETVVGYARSFVGYDPVLLGLGLAGLFAALRRRALLPPMLFVLGWGAFFMTNQNEHMRYLLPMAVLLAIPAGLAAERLAWRPVGAVALGLLLAVPLVQSLRLGYVLRQDDTRAIGEELLADLPEDARVAIDVYGPVVPQTQEALLVTDELRRLSGSSLYGREQHRLAMLAAGLPQPPGVNAIRVEDVFEYDRRHEGTWIREPLVEWLGTSTAEALDSLGVTHLLLVDRTPDDGHPPPLLDPDFPLPYGDGDTWSDPVRKLAPLALPEADVWTVHPSWSEPTSSADGTAPDAHLPTALRFPLRDLWRVRRPGPKLQLYALPTPSER